MWILHFLPVAPVTQDYQLQSAFKIKIQSPFKIKIGLWFAFREVETMRNGILEISWLGEIDE